MRTRQWWRALVVAVVAVPVVTVAALAAHSSALEGPVFSTPSAGNTATPMGVKWSFSLAGTRVPLPMGCGTEKRILWYGPGTAADVLWRNITFPDVGSPAKTSVSLSVGGAYKPFTGDFNGDGCEDVFWYTPGTGADMVWFFSTNGTHITVPVTQNATAIPIVGRFTADARDDVFWYIAGTGKETIWAGNANGTFSAKLAPQMSTTYTPVLAVDPSSILWYRAGTGSDLLWRGLKAGATAPTSSATLAITPTYTPRNLGGKGFLYAPGTASDLLITGVSAAPVKLRTLAGKIDGTYVVSTSTAKAGFGVLYSSTSAVDYLVKPTATPPSVMGNGKVEVGEACDDGNLVSGDGCSSVGDIELGFQCSGQPSICITAVGDGIVAGTEACDDGNQVSGDGCAADGSIEAGFQCTGQPSVCTTSMGDGIVAGAEQCDDGNTTNGDGCSSSGVVEGGFSCTGQPSVCVLAVAGDGIVAPGEQCDDGNTTAGDGCSPAATIEAGFICSSQPSVCTNTSALVINEVDYDNIGTDTAEFVEIFNRSGSSVSLTGKKLVLVNGATSLPYTTVDISVAGSIPAGGYLVVAPTGFTVPGGVPLVTFAVANDNIQNGAPDAVALIDSTTGTVLDSLSYEGAMENVTITGVSGHVSMVEGSLLSAIVADSNTAVGSLSRISNGTDTNNAATDWQFTAVLTPGASNQPTPG